jgi:hypothetical protein
LIFKNIPSLCFETLFPQARDAVKRAEVDYNTAGLSSIIYRRPLQGPSGDVRLRLRQVCEIRLDKRPGAALYGDKHLVKPVPGESGPGEKKMTAGDLR